MGQLFVEIELLISPKCPYVRSIYVWKTFYKGQTLFLLKFSRIANIHDMNFALKTILALKSEKVSLRGMSPLDPCLIRLWSEGVTSRIDLNHIWKKRYMTTWLYTPTAYIQTTNQVDCNMDAHCTAVSISDWSSVPRSSVEMPTDVNSKKSRDPRR